MCCCKCCKMQQDYFFLTTQSLFLWAILQQGVRFDPDMPQTIRLEFAKSNTKVSKPKQQAANAANTHPTLMHPLTGRKYTTSSIGPPSPGFKGVGGRYNQPTFTAHHPHIPTNNHVASRPLNLL